MLCVPREQNKRIVFIRVENWKEVIKLEQLAK